MFKNRFVLIVVVLSVLLVTLAVAKPALNAPVSVDLSQPPRSDFSPLSQSDLVPVTGGQGRLALADYHQRHPELSSVAGSAVDTSDHFLRHPEPRTIDLSDYFLRHPELGGN